MGSGRGRDVPAPERPSDTRGAVGEHPKVHRLMEGGKATIDFAPRRQMREGVVKEGRVFRKGEKFNFMECLEQGRPELIGGTELGGPGGAVFFKGKMIETGRQKRSGVR